MQLLEAGHDAGSGSGWELQGLVTGSPRGPGQQGRAPRRIPAVTGTSRLRWPSLPSRAWRPASVSPPSTGGSGEAAWDGAGSSGTPRCHRCGRGAQGHVRAGKRSRKARGCETSPWQGMAAGLPSGDALASGTKPPLCEPSPPRPAGKRHRAAFWGRLAAGARPRCPTPSPAATTATPRCPHHPRVSMPEPHRDRRCHRPWRMQHGPSPRRMLLLHQPGAVGPQGAAGAAAVPTVLSQRSGSHGGPGDHLVLSVALPTAETPGWGVTGIAAPLAALGKVSSTPEPPQLSPCSHCQGDEKPWQGHPGPRAGSQAALGGVSKAKPWGGGTRPPSLPPPLFAAPAHVEKLRHSGATSPRPNPARPSHAGEASEPQAAAGR